jgi:exoribonuclease II
MYTESTSCCGMSEIVNMNGPTPLLKRELREELQSLRRRNIAVAIATTISVQTNGAKALEEMGFIAAEEKAKRKRSGNAITLWTRGVNDYTEAEDRILAG